LNYFSRKPNFDVLTVSLAASEKNKSELFDSDTFEQKQQQKFRVSHPRRIDNKKVNIYQFGHDLGFALS
jgi:hypothetical protein